ncbi:MAG: T9SS type A sorting domain-containing protein [Flavobacteriales bacterium]|nr:T9SS type A sorting domain-containing protein [Flavobacteriales bacterium]
MVTVSEECTGSIATYDATDATESLPAVTCGNPPFTSPEARDLWFSFVATSTATSVQVEGTLSFDPVIEGFSGTCGDLNSIGCADATFPPATPENTTETLTMATVVGSTYFVRVYSYWAPEPTEFDFTLCIFGAPPAPANDVCSGAAVQNIAIGASATFTGDNTGALDTEGLGVPNVWEAFTITECADVTLDLCGNDPAFTAWFQVLFIGCPETGSVFNSSSDTETCPDGNVTLHFTSVPAGTYYYAVPVGDEAGAYTVNVSVAALPAGYCEASAATCDESIAQVTLGTIDNTSDCTDGTLGDYTDQSTDFIQSQGFDITVVNGPSSTPQGDAVTVWVDWNQDGSFCDHNEEKVLETADDGLTFTGLILAPVNAAVGSTRMRVRMAYVAEGYVPSACGEAQYGEVEDYTINVIQGNGIEEFDNLDWLVYPNPNNGDMTIRYAGLDSKVSIELFDVAGRAVHQEQRQLFNGQQVRLGLNGTLANGLYTVRLTTAGGRSEQRVTVQ